MTHVLRQSRRAMACDCEVVIVHESVSAATSAATAALEEITRVESLLSRFDPASEIARINRDAVHGSVCVDFELCQLLARCRDACQDTGGTFEIAAHHAGPTSQTRWQLDTVTRIVQVHSKSVQLDLGGCGKGYALDCAGEILRAAGVTQAFLQAGTSSILSLGVSPDGTPWQVALADPRNRTAPPFPFPLSFEALSTSAIGSDGNMIDPRTGVPLVGLRSCTASAATAFDAEVWSTAGLILGRDGICKLPPVPPSRSYYALVWLVSEGCDVHVDWLRQPSAPGCLT